VAEHSASRASHVASKQDPNVLRHVVVLAGIIRKKNWSAHRVRNLSLRNPFNWFAVSERRLGSFCKKARTRKTTNQLSALHLKLFGDNLTALLDSMHHSRRGLLHAIRGANARAAAVLVNELDAAGLQVVLSGAPISDNKRLGSFRNKGPPVLIASASAAFEGARLFLTVLVDELDPRGPSKVGSKRPSIAA